MSKLHRHRNKHVLLVGDFNIDLLKYDHDTTSQAMINSTTNFGYSQVISKPTRITDHSATLIDHIFTNQVYNINKSGIITYDISDHLATFVSVALYDRLNSDHLTEPSGRSEQLKFNETNLTKFKELLNNDDWDDVLNEPDTQLKYDNFVTKYTTHYDTAFSANGPVRRKKQRNSSKPWILPWLEEACDRKNKLYATYINEPTARNKAIYNKMNKFVKKHIKLAKKKYYDSYFKQHSNNSRKQWQMINKLLNRGKSKLNNIKLQDANGQLLKKPCEVADKFNTYFTSIAEKLKSENNSDTNHKLFMTDPSVNSITIRPTNQTELTDIITSLKNKATSDSKICALKAASTVHNFSAVLADVINSSLDKGVFPSQLKIAKVIPIHKSGSKMDVANYRPISLLSSFSKIFEKIMHRRVANFLENNNALHDMQYGFRAGRSCEQALLVANNEILSALGKKQIALLLLIDFSKAFDMVDHDIMIDKLEHYGIRGTANKWFKSYLAQRKQFVSIQGESSGKLPLKYSVPQGSILGPLLFIIYINDIPNINKFAKFILYADDANIIITGSHVSEIAVIYEELVSNLVKWVSANALALNIKKTNYMLFTRARNTSFDSFKPKLANAPIERSSVARFLGVLVDDKLTWSNQIAAIKTKMSRFIGTVYKLKSMLPLTARLTIYNSLVQSHLNFCSLLWGTSCKSNIAKLFTAQKKAIRAIMPGYVNYFYKEGLLPTHTKTFFTKHCILTVHNIILKNILIFINNTIRFSNTLPRSIKQLIPHDAPTIMLDSDHNSDWYTKYNSLPYNNTVFFKGPLLYKDIMSTFINDMPDSHTKILSRASYKTKFKSHLLSLQKAGEECEWEGNNFRLLVVTGLRKSERLRGQDISAGDGS